ncbi:polysaccharide deacetylase family protein [Paenibacillus gansuensis]|uniref:Polysaccharide deacetylase family protein n=1 Tax=Paenibacillus gansuensis TaxID=306542 RepID=A0ABW5PEX1_9BACL
MNGKKVWVILCTAVISFGVFTMPGPIGEYTAFVKSSHKQSITAAALSDDRLLLRIREEAAKQYVKPIDARVDRVWKAIPGYNGLEVDIARTHRINADKGPQDQLQIVYREIPASVDLSQLPPNPVYKGNPRKPMVSLMINVAWGDEFLPVMLKTLKEEHVQATFFLDGTWLKSHKETAKEILAQGHELSNHAYSHKNMSQLTESRAREEIIKTEKLLREIGVNNKLFAPPSGDFDQETVNIAKSMNLQTVLWTLDTVDWTNPSPASVIRKISTRVEAGSMILMHPTSASSQALPEMIRNIKRKGYVLGTVSELLSPARVPKVEDTFAF